MNKYPVNIRSGQLSITDAAYVELTEDDRHVRVLYAETAALWVSIGHDTPNDTTSFKMPAGSSLELQPSPTGKVYVKSVLGAQIVYTYGA